MKQFVAAFVAIASLAGVCAGAGKCVVTYTFDDGLADQYTIAYPMFRKAGLPATFFIIGSKVGDSRGMRSKAERNTPVMTWEQIRDMSKNGMEIASHGWAHAKYAKMNRDDILDDIRRNQIALKEYVGVDCVSFASPFNTKKGADGSDVEALAKEAGLRAVRMKQKGAGGKMTAENMNALVESAKKKGEWLVFMIHGMARGYDAWENPEELEKHLSWVKEQKDVQVLSFADAEKHSISMPERTKPFAVEVKVANDAWLRSGDDEVVCRQGGGIFRFGDAWYRYGVDYPVAHEFASNSVRIAKGSYDGARVVAFVSRDFAQWEAKGSVVADGEIPPGWLGRMGAAKVGETYAIVIQTALGVSVYTATDPLGPFRHSHELDFTGITGFKGTGDQTVFADEDAGKYYLVFSKPKGRDRTFVGELGICEDGRIGIVNWKEVFSGWNREANCMFKRGGRYYLCASNIYGWDASLTYWLVGDTPFGPFERAKGADMNVMAGCERDYSHVSQVGFFYTLRGADGRELVLYYGDRWTQWADNGKGFEVCEPITFDEAGAPRFHSLSSWWLDPKAATWRVADDNNWCLNGSFDADRRLLPLASKPRQEHLTGWNVEVVKGNRIALDNPASPRLNASNSVSDHAFVTGKLALSINDTVPFRRRVSQKLAGLPDGEYTLSYMIDEGNGWQRRTETLAAANGECEIVFDRTAPCRIDDITLTKQEKVR